MTWLKENFKPEKTGFAAWHEHITNPPSNQDKKRNSQRFESDPYKQKEFANAVANTPKPKPDIWEQRATWIIVGIIIVIIILWLANSGSHEPIPYDVEQCFTPGCH
jgi:hypothetical protein